MTKPIPTGQLADHEPRPLAAVRASMQQRLDHALDEHRRLIADGAPAADIAGAKATINALATWLDVIDRDVPTKGRRAA